MREAVLAGGMYTTDRMTHVEVCENEKLSPQPIAPWPLKSFEVKIDRERPLHQSALV